MTQWVKITTCGVVLALVALAAFGEESCKDYWSSTYAGLPRSDELDDEIIVLLNEGFVVGYSDIRMDPLWVYYRVCSADFSTAVGGKPWKSDCRTKTQVTTDDYKWTGYDRGHMAPNSAIAHCYNDETDEAQRQTFLMSNVCPQLHAMNDGPWGDIEDWVRGNMGKFGELWVIAGPIFDDSNGYQYLEKDAEHASLSQKPVEIPEKFYKIIVDEVAECVRVLAFIVPQEATYGEPIEIFLRSVDEIEETSGLDFLWELQDDLEEMLETATATALW